MRPCNFGLAIALALSTGAQAQSELSGSVSAEAPGLTEKQKRDAKNWGVLHRLYPKIALANREEGLVGFVVKIDAAGSATECRVTHTSGYASLDQYTCPVIMAAATFKRPRGISHSQQRLHEGVVNWKLPGTPLDAVPAVPAPIQAAAAPDPIVCKRTRKIGTLAAFERTCMTARQWDLAVAESRDLWGDIRRRGFTCSKRDGTCPPGD